MRPAFVLAWLLATPAQDRDAELARQVADLTDRAASLDPASRSEAHKQAPELFRKNEAKIVRFAQSKDEARRIPALVLAAIVGKHSAEKLLDIDDLVAVVVGCDLLPENAALIPRLQELMRHDKVSVRLAAARALGRFSDQPARTQIQTELSKAWQDKAVGPDDVLGYYVMAHWNAFSYSQTIQSYISSADLPTAETALAALLNVPNFQPGANLETQAAAALRNEKLSIRLRELLLRFLAREMPSSLISLLTLPNSSLRSQVVELVDRAVDNPLMVRPLVEIARKPEVAKLGDGREPPQSLMSWIEKWLGRLTGEFGGGLDGHEKWLQVKFKSVLDERADAAIKKGVEALKAQQKEDGTWAYNDTMFPVGVTGLAVYTLLKCDAKVDDKSVLRGVEVLLAKDPEGVYSASLVAMALATMVEKIRAQKKTTAAMPRLQSRLQEIVDILVASQKATGGWSYDIKLKTGTGVQAPPAAGQDRYDFSNTQFAVLGLRAGANAGARVPRTTWERSLALYEKHQSEKDGGWPYIGEMPGIQGTPSSSMAMTAAGAYGWMICKTSLDDKLAPDHLRTQERVARGIEYLAKNWQVDASGLADAYYWLYSVERMGMAGRIDRIGERDWYVEGATWLLVRQRPDGSWVGNYGATVDTCLALLFLKRAYIATPYIETEGGGGRKK
jgi:hypothetical protein